MSMEIVSIEAGTFHKMNQALENIIQKLRKGDKTGYGKGLEEWLDNQDVCVLLDISPSKLLTLRRNGSIAYSRIDRKIYYRRKDIMAFMEHELKRQETE